MIDPFLIKKSAKKYDAIVVGSGISGGWAAKELCEKGLKVLLIERGRAVKHREDYSGEGKAPWEFDHRGRVATNLINDQYRIQKKCYAFNDATKHFFANDKDYPYTSAEGTAFDWIRGNQLGGRSLIWHRQSFRFSELSFEENARDGYGCDWPIRYKDLAPWYSYVEKFTGVSGSKDKHPQLPDSECLPPFEMNSVELYAKALIERKYPDRKMLQGRCAHLSEATPFFLEQGRSKCMARNQCQRGCSFGAYFSTQSSTLPAALKTNNLRIACNSVVDSLRYDDKTNRVTGVNVIDEETLETREYQANMVFMCASTIGTTQIMLNSTSKAFPNGIANSSGVLGHYLMDHIYNSEARGEIEGFSDDYYKGNRPTNPVIPRFQNLKKQTQAYARGYFLRGGAARTSVVHGIGNKDFGASFKKSLQKPGPWGFGWGGSGEMLPMFDNQMTLDSSKTDKWGMPLIEFNCKWTDNDYKMMQAMADDAAEILESIGAKNVKRNVSDAPPGLAIHEMGTARMGRDANTSVLNGNNQCHDIPNLFITDGSCMPSSGHVNPSLTYMALTARAADFAVKAYRDKKI
ncbi:MAG: GMC family oxidoreductase [Cellvibrionaceae bacterium]|nr:GMC family oxidoreductase [Cellvibrionaceae bacterium]